MMKVYEGWNRSEKVMADILAAIKERWL